MPKTSPFFLILVLAISCTDSDHDKIQGSWKVSNYHEVYAGIHLPKSEEFSHYVFEGDSLFIYSLGSFDNQTPKKERYQFKLESDTIFLRSNKLDEYSPRWAYQFNEDTLILNSGYYLGGVGNHENRKLTKIEEKMIGEFIFPDGIYGDWIGTDTYTAREDSLNHRIHSSFNRNIRLDNKSILVFTQNNEILLHSSEIKVTKDSINIYDDKLQSKKYILNKDTLILIGPSTRHKKDTVLVQKFIRSRFDEGKISYLKSYKLDPENLATYWSTDFDEFHPDILSHVDSSLSIPNKPIYTSFPPNPRCYFNHDTLILKMDHNTSKFLVKDYYRYDNYHGFGKLFVHPIFNNREIDSMVIFTSGGH